MKNKSPQLVIAGWMLVAAFLANAWSLGHLYVSGTDPTLPGVLDDPSQLVPWFTSQFIADFPTPLLAALEILARYASAFLSLIFGAVSLVKRKRAFVVIGGIILLLKLPVRVAFLGSIPDFLSALFPVDGIGDIYSSALAMTFDLRWALNGFEAAMALSLLGYIFAAIAVVLALIPIPAKINVSPEISQKPVAYDTQTGRPIFGYDTQTGEPIYEHGSNDKKSD